MLKKIVIAFKFKECMLPPEYCVLKLRTVYDIVAVIASRNSIVPQFSIFERPVTWLLSALDRRSIAPG